LHLTSTASQWALAGLDGDDLIDLLSQMIKNVGGISVANTQKTTCQSRSQLAFDKQNYNI
jgi:hypothetical protein